MRLIKLGEVSQINSSNIEHLKLTKIVAELKFVLYLNYPYISYQNICQILYEPLNIKRLVWLVIRVHLELLFCESKAPLCNAAAYKKKIMNYLILVMLK